MRFVIAATMFFAMAPVADASEPRAYEAIMAEAETAFAAENWSALAEALDAAQQLRPYSLFLARNRILAYALREEFAAALALAGKLAERGLSIRLAGHPGFDALARQPGFAEIAERMRANNAQIGAANIALVIPDDRLLAESYLEDRESGRRYVGSVRAGVIVDAAGATFATAPGGVYGLEIVGDEIWAVASNAPPYEKAGAADATAGLYAFDRATGALARGARSADDKALFGDLENTPAGIVVSDSVTPRLMILRRGEAALAPFAADSRFVNLQGLAYDRRRKKLFVADYLAGIFVIDMKSGAVTELRNDADAHLGGVDGLCLHKGDLVGVQNGTTPQRIVRIALDKKGRAATRLDVLQQSIPEWREPTNGQVIGDALYYVATSNWPAYGADGSLNEEIARAPVTIMIAPLGAPGITPAPAPGN